MTQTAGNNTWIELMREEADDELRTVSFRETSTGVQVCEQTDGEGTMLAFGTLSRRQTIAIGHTSARLMANLLAESAPDKEAYGVLHNFFSEGAYLSDLQDLLDTAKISYAYSVVSGSNASFRSQEE